jgi:hypothetical protein
MKRSVFMLYAALATGCVHFVPVRASSLQTVSVPDSTVQASLPAAEVRGTREAELKERGALLTNHVVVSPMVE